MKYNRFLVNFGVDPDIVWSIVSDKVPELLASLQSVDPDSGQA
jgi:hypothetical protein